MTNLPTNQSATGATGAIDPFTGEPLSYNAQNFINSLPNDIKQEFLYLIYITQTKITFQGSYELKLAQRLRDAQNFRYAQINNIVKSQTDELDEFEKIILAYNDLPRSPNVLEPLRIIRGPINQASSYMDSYSYEQKHNRYSLYKRVRKHLSFIDAGVLKKWDVLLRLFTEDPDFFIKQAKDDSQSSSGIFIWPDIESTGENKIILETIKYKESRGDYNEKNPDSSASGAYQYMDATWQTMAKNAWNDVKAKAAIIAGFREVGQTPPASAEDFISLHNKNVGQARYYPPRVQDAVADYNVTKILRENGNKVNAVPLVWYIGTAELRELTPKEKAINSLSPTEYQNEWLIVYNDILKNNKA